MRGRGILGVLVCSMILGGLNAYAGDTGLGREILGSLTTASAGVRVDNVVAIPGATLMAGDVIATDGKSTATVRFRSGASAALAMNTEVALTHDLAVTSLNLRGGAIEVRSAPGQTTRVGAKGTAVIVQGERGLPALCRIAAVGSSLAIFNDRGRVEIHALGAPIVLPVGKYAQVEAGRPQGGAQTAGKVSAAIPAEVVQRQGTGAELPLKLSDVVYWQDVVRTERTGRVRIELLDGSFLNVGARSQMRIVKHDPNTQQTEVEMTLGKLRGEIVKLTKPGASFQIKTQTAVIGVVGTIVMIIATPRFTRVICLEGMVRVSNINAAITGVTTLRAGQVTTVFRNMPPTGGVNFSPSNVQNQVAQTNAQPGGGAGAGGAGGLGGTATTVTNVTTTATGATSAALTSVGVVRMGDATSTLNVANATLTNAQGELTNATTAANEAAGAAANVNAGVQTFIQQVASPSQPGCGCE